MASQKRGFISPEQFLQGKNLPPNISVPKPTPPTFLATLPPDFNDFANFSLEKPLPKETVATFESTPKRKEDPETTHYKNLLQQYQDIIQRGLTEQNIEPLVNELRKLILLEGLPPHKFDPIRSETGLSTRAMVWKILVGVQDLDINQYLSLVEKGPCPKIYDEKRKATLYDKIRNDTHRTFKTDENYHMVVPEEKLIRVLNAFCNSGDEPERQRKSSLLQNVSASRRLSAKEPTKPSGYQPWYVQGMNCIAGVFLYQMPELDAFYCFKKLAYSYCPLYYCESIEGAYTGTQLAEEVLKLVDADLYNHLNTLLQKQATNLSTTAQTIASQLTQPILSLGADSKPLDQVLKLWDFFLAFGIHLNVIVTVARLVSVR